MSGVPDIDWPEARRYLGLHRPGGPPDPDMEARLRSSGALLMETARPRAVWKRFPLILEENRVLTAGMEIESRYLRRHLRNCTHVYLFAATLGLETDRLLHRLGVTEVSRAVMVQACAASLLEAYCDECCAQIAGEVRAEGLFLRPRFSPGYSDFPITWQRRLLEAVDAPRRIGLTATGGMMLTPTKSVTAVVGLTTDPDCSRPGGCAQCAKSDCTFRRNT